MERDAKYRIHVEKEGEGFQELESDILKAASAAESGEEALKKVAEQVDAAAQAVGKGKLTWKEFQGLLKNLVPPEVGIDWSKLTPDLVVKQKIQQVGEAFADFAEKAESGSDEAAQAAFKARRELDELKKAAEELKSSGVGLTNSYEKELEQLENQYRETMKAAGQYAAKQAEVDRQLTRSRAQAGDYGAEISSVEGAIASLSPGLATFVTRLSAITAGFTAGYSAGGQVLSLLGSIDEALNTKLLKTLNEFTTDKLQGVADWWFDVAPDAQDEAEELTHVLKQLRAEGLEPQGQTLEEVRSQLERYRQEQGEVARATSESQRRTEEWLRSLDLSAREIKKTGVNLGELINNLVDTDAFADLDFGAFIDRVGSQLGEALTGMEVTGVGVPPGLKSGIEKILEELGFFMSEGADSLDAAGFEQKIKRPVQALLDSLQGAPQEIREQAEEIAAAFGILPTEVEARLRRIEGLADGFSEAWRKILKIPDDVDNPAETLEALTRSLRELAAESSELGMELGDQSSEQQAEVIRNIEEQLELYKRLGGEHNEMIQQIDANLGLSVTGWESNTEAVRQSEQAVRDLGSAADGIGSGADGIRELGTAASESATGLREAEAASLELTTTQDEHGNTVHTLTQKTRELSTAARDASAAQNEGAGSARSAADGYGSAADALDDLKSSTTEAGKAQEDLDFDDANKGLEDQADSTKKAGKGFENLSKNVESTTASQQELLQRNEELVQSLSEVEQGLATTVVGIADLPSKLEESFAVIQREAAKLPATAKEAFSGAAREVDPLLQKLGVLRTELANVRKDIADVKADGEALTE